MVVSSDIAQDQVDRNYAAFSALLPGLMKTHAGKWALFHDENLEAIFDTDRDAHVAGQKLFPDRVFSVQEIRMGALDLGWFSRALL